MKFNEIYTKPSYHQAIPHTSRLTVFSLIHKPFKNLSVAWQAIFRSLSLSLSLCFKSQRLTSGKSIVATSSSWVRQPWRVQSARQNTERRCCDAVTLLEVFCAMQICIVASLGLQEVCSVHHHHIIYVIYQLQRMINNESPSKIH